ncbi:MAG TPA: uroporphyrinogen decarboxylase family protein [Candidatus Brocadiia bacterium]|nr:uroporphyrinogen decarboxylase family protein [Candidatus Brocadiia bacterium]
MSWNTGLDPKVEERIMLSLNHREGDRVPIWDFIDNHKVVRHFAGAESDLLKAMVKVYHGLEIDLCRGFGHAFSPEDEGVRPDGAVVSGLTHWHRPHIATIEQLRAFKTPLPTREELDSFIAGFIACRQAFAPLTMYVPCIGMGFHAAYGLMGIERFSYFMADAEDEILRVMWELNARYVEYARIAAEKKICPIFFVGDDIAYKRALIFSPDFLRRTCIPMLAKICDVCAGAGMKLIFHSDGDLTKIMDDLVDAGIEGINPIEPIAGMDIGLMKRRYGDRLVLVGNVDCSQVLPLGTKEDVIKATIECLRAAAPGGGHFIGSSSEITPATPLENVLTFYDACRQYGKYPINL